MALPNSEQSKQLAYELFSNATKPIYPNLIRRQTPLEFMVRKSFEQEDSFRRRIFLKIDNN